MRILVVNAGSSSMKLRVLGDTDELLAAEDLGRPDGEGVRAKLEEFLEQSPSVDAVGHRVVHGGPQFRQPVRIDARVDAALQELADLAPLHNPPSLAAIRELRSVRPDLPQIACFDTTFHADMPPRAATYAIPRTWRERWGIHRYGFHGLSHSWASRRAGELLARPREDLRLVTAHIGAGASLAAVDHGRSVDTTMGFTPMEGLVMATRAGSLDPGVVLWVQRHGGLSAEAVEDALERESGLLGLSETSADLQVVIEAADRGVAEAALAYDVYAYRIRTGVAAMAGAMGGIDGLVFTGGAGERSSRLRADVCAGLGFLGLASDGVGAEVASDDVVLSPAGVIPAVVVVHAREDLEIARHVRQLLASSGVAEPIPPIVRTV